MPFCSHCDIELPQGAKFCPKCGAPIVLTITCPRCGKTEIPSEAMFCPKCGNILKESPKKPEEKPLSECGNKISIDGHYVVDLGLSVKWSLYNIGSQDIKSCGITFSWGDSTRKTITSSWSRGWFVPPSKENICGDPKFDMATYNWGSLWRLPRAEECQELLDKCDWYQVNYKGQSMVKIVGPNDNYMLVPSEFKIWIGNYANSSSVCYFDISLDINRYGIESMLYDVESLMYVRPVTK